MNDFMSLNDYYVSTRPPASATRPHPLTTTPRRRTVRRAVASGLHRLAGQRDG